jgi:cardiolipin synthase
MSVVTTKPAESSGVSLLRLLADQAFSRAAGAPLIPGNKIQILKNAQENYPAWLDAIRSAKKTIHFESYIIHADEVGLQFCNELIAKAQQSVRVRVIYDWLGARGTGSWRYWRRLRKAGVEVRCFNRPQLDSPLGWLNRDHRKMITVDGRIGFVTGLCVGKSWVGDPKRGIEPWRDTGVVIEGPAVADIERAFREIWATMGPPIPEADATPIPETIPFAGDVTLRIVATQPDMAGLYRLDHLVAALARDSIWLTDAYFLGTTTYVQALRAAALDGVDVRLLLPRASDIPVIRSVSRAGYRALLEAGVRIFEWNGPMLHAKTAVADGRWARVGSTNLNIASWMENYELDVVVENEPFARAMEDMYLEDLTHATEIVLSRGHKVRPTQKRARLGRRRGAARGSAGRALTGVIRIGSTMRTAITNSETLGPAEAAITLSGAIVVICLALLAAFFPLVTGIVIAALGGWLGLSLLIRAFRLRFPRKE